MNICVSELCHHWFRLWFVAWTNTGVFRVTSEHDDVIKWKPFPRYWPFVRGIHRSPVNSPHKGQWRGALMFSLICARINGWVNNREAGDLIRYRAHYNVILIIWVKYKNWLAHNAMHLKLSSVRWRIFYLVLNMLIQHIWYERCFDLTQVWAIGEMHKINT